MTVFCDALPARLSCMSVMGGFRRLLVLALIALALAACPGERKAPEPVISENLRAIPPGESVIVEFPADGASHASGFVARPGDQIVFVPLGEAAFIERRALLVRIGRTRHQMVYRKAPQQITRRGEFVFVTDMLALGPYPEKTIRVQIENHAPAERIESP